MTMTIPTATTVDNDDDNDDDGVGDTKDDNNGRRMATARDDGANARDDAAADVDDGGRSAAEARQGAERLRAIGDQAAQQIGGGSSAWPLPATMVAFDARLLAQAPLRASRRRRRR